LKAYGPRKVLADCLRGERGIEAAFLFGSWAARYQGEWGPPPADVDVVVIGRPSITRMEEVETDAEGILGQPVQLTVVPADVWKRASDPFVQTVRARPLVPVTDDAA